MLLVVTLIAIVITGGLAIVTSLSLSLSLPLSHIPGRGGRGCPNLLHKALEALWIHREVASRPSVLLAWL